MQQQRKAGRPSGTDGSDFSYRMVVDSRYTRVANEKSRLFSLFLTQAVIQLVGLFSILFSVSNKHNISNKFAVSSSVTAFISLLIGDVGRRRSRASLLRVYIVTSSIAILLSLFSALSSTAFLEVISNPSDWERKKFELLEISIALLGLLLQIFTVITAASLIGNMAPPKKAS